MRYRLLGRSNNGDLSGRSYVAMQSDNDVVLANLTQSAFRQTNFSFGHFNASGGQGISDVTSADGAEQLAFVTRFGGDYYRFQSSQFLGTSFSSSQLRSHFGFQLGATSFKHFQVSSASYNCFALRQQVVTSVTGFNSNFVAQATQLGNLNQPKNVPYLSSTYS